MQTPAGAAARIADRRLHRLPGQTPAAATPRWRRRADHRRDPAAAARRPADLSQGARPRLLRLRAGLGRGDRRCRTAARSATRASRWAASRTSRGARGGRARAGRRAGRCRRRLRAAAGEAARKGAQGRGHNDFKIPLAARAWWRARSATLRDREGLTWRHDHRPAHRPHRRSRQGDRRGAPMPATAAPTASAFGSSSPATIGRGRITGRHQAAARRAGRAAGDDARERAGAGAVPGQGRGSPRPAQAAARRGDRSSISASRWRWSSPRRSSRRARRGAAGRRSSYQTEAGRLRPRVGQQARLYPGNRVDRRQGRLAGSATSTAASPRAPCKIDATYTTPYQSHNPMEPHASLASWDGRQAHDPLRPQLVESAHHSIASTR